MCIKECAPHGHHCMEETPYKKRCFGDALMKSFSHDNLVLIRADKILKAENEHCEYNTCQKQHEQQKCSVDLLKLLPQWFSGCSYVVMNSQLSPSVYIVTVLFMVHVN